MSSETILVVDDEQRIVETVSFCLEKEGYNVTGAFSGKEALSLIKINKFDILLLDINMPQMDGYEVMEHVFNYDQDMLVIIMTAYASVESAVKALKNGAWDYLKKPFQFLELKKTVENALIHKKLVSENKRVIQKLAAVEKQYEHIVNNSPDLIFTLDCSRCFTFANDQFEKVLGIKKEEIIGKEFISLIHPLDVQKANSLFSIEASGQQAEKEISIHFKSKKSVSDVNSNETHEAFPYMELKASAMYLPCGDSKTQFSGTYVVARDITERVNLEEQLRQAQKMEAIGTMAGGIAHDFNNTLMGIQGYASLVKTGFEKDSIEYKRLSSIDEYVSNGAQMAKQLLGFAQKSFQQTSLVNINHLLKLSANMFGRTKKDIIITQDFEERIWSTKVDEGQIKQVIMNLFVNAWQAMPDGGRITIKSENITLDKPESSKIGLKSPGNYVKVSVSDSGTGMKKNIISKIFDPFFTTKEREEGTGLGLATAFGIIKSHKGMFKVDTQLGYGSAFMFYLPAEQEVVVKTKEIDSGNNEMISGKGTVLLIDDEISVMEVCTDMIESLGFVVKPAFSGVRALEILSTENEPIDLIILDMVMPEMSGDETFEKIKQLRPDVKVIISSGYSRSGEIDKMLKKGCDAVISKPFDMTTLSQKINLVLKDELVV